MRRATKVVGPTKTHQRRTLSLPSFVLERVGARLSEIGPGPDQLLFFSKTGAPVRYANFRRHVWNKAVAAADLVGVKPHDLRASHPSWLIDRGFSVMDVAARLGHSSAAVTTRYYARPMAGRDQDIAAMLDRSEVSHEDAELARSWHVPQQGEPVDRESHHLISR